MRLIAPELGDSMPIPVALEHGACVSCHPILEEAVAGNRVTAYPFTSLAPEGIGMLSPYSRYAVTLFSEDTLVHSVGIGHVHRRPKIAAPPARKTAAHRFGCHMLGGSI